MASEGWYEDARRAGFGHEDPRRNAALSGGEVFPEGPDFEALESAYPDIRAWIFSPGTLLDYPVVQSGDNAYYLEHLPDGTANRNGSVFMDWRNQGDFTDRLTAVYGHHIRGGRMFSVLDGYKDQAYYEEHPFLYLYTPTGACRLELLAGTVLDGAGGIPVDGTVEEQTAWLEDLSARSTFRPAGPAASSRESVPAGSAAPSQESVPAGSGLWEAGQRYVVLCTCTYEYSNARYAVVGRLRGQEAAGTGGCRESAVKQEKGGGKK